MRPHNSRFEVELDYLSDGRLHVRKRSVKVTTQVVLIILNFVTVQTRESVEGGSSHIADQISFLGAEGVATALHFHIISQEIALSDQHRSLR